MFVYFFIMFYKSIYAYFACIYKDIRNNRCCMVSSKACSAPVQTLCENSCQQSDVGDVDSKKYIHIITWDIYTQYPCSNQSAVNESFYYINLPAILWINRDTYIGPWLTRVENWYMGYFQPKVCANIDKLTDILAGN